MNTRKENRDRNLNIDILRVVCSIFIVIIHIIDFYILNYNEIGEIFWTFINIFESFIRFAVPIFFMISGALLIKNFKESAITFYKKRLIKIVVPYILISIFYSIGNQILKNGIISLEIIIKNILTFDAHYHLWFFEPLIGIYLIVPLIRKVIVYLENNNKKIIINGYLAIWTSLGIILPTIINIYSLSSIRYGIEVVNYLGYFIMGYAISNYYKSFFKGKENWVLLIYLVAVLTTIAGNHFYLNRETGIYNNYFIYPMTLNIYVQSVSIFIYFNLKVIKLNKSVTSIIQSISVSSIYIYLLHPIFILIVKDILKINLFVGNLFFKCFFVISIVSLLTIVASIIAFKTFNFLTKTIIK
ncbi:acyltransferase [Clostridium sp. MB05]|uniref:acyltransferase n=2 Tax=Clostridium TaxID=1485 RepID=UPI003981B766